MEPKEIAENALNSKKWYCKFITPNDTGLTGSNQAGFYVHKKAWPILFDTPGSNGSNKDKYVKILWNNDFTTDSRFIYYGSRTRNEYRITRFGKSFPFLKDENIGDLVVLCQIEPDYYEAFVISGDEDIESFLELFGLSPNDTNTVFESSKPIISSEDCIQGKIVTYTKAIHEFPSSNFISQKARNIVTKCKLDLIKKFHSNPDSVLVEWINAEFLLFQKIEQKLYVDYISNPLESVEKLVTVANTVLNRRKSRAGKSLENHLHTVFSLFELKFETQGITEGNKKPDFIFPSFEYYHNAKQNDDKLIFLGAKTTCKDRWRQILNEADKIQNKHLFTLQQGVSSNQMKEMSKHNVTLVVPKKNIKLFPVEYRDKLITLKGFTDLIKDRQV